MRQLVQAQLAAQGDSLLGVEAKEADKELGWLLIEGLQEIERATAKPLQPTPNAHNGCPVWKSSSSRDLHLYRDNNSHWAIGPQLGSGSIATAVAVGSTSPEGDGDWKVYNQTYKFWDTVRVRVCDLGRCEDAFGAETKAASLRADLPLLADTADTVGGDGEWNTPLSGQQTTTRRSKSPLRLPWRSPDRQREATAAAPAGAANDAQPKRKSWWSWGDAAR